MKHYRAYRFPPLDVIQAQMGHASIQTTTAIYGRAPIKRRVDELGKAFGDLDPLTQVINKARANDGTGQSQ